MAILGKGSCAVCRRPGPCTGTYCLVCYSSRLHQRRAISPCGHDDICWQCHLQMRYLHSDNKCPVCKTENDTLIVDADVATVTSNDADDGQAIHHKRFDQYRLWGNDLGSGYVFLETVGMHFPSEIYERHVVALLGYGCGIPGCEFSNAGDSYVNEKEARSNEFPDQCVTIGGEKREENPRAGQREVKKRLTGLKALKTHLRIDHGYALCDLCVENRRDFVSKLSRYTPQGLKAHQSRGDGGTSGFTGHPLCEFCRPLRFYDIVKLHEHLNKEHYKCHICDKLGKPNQFFKDYPRLERHFDREHYLCHDAQCLAARFIVFENEIDLRGHERSVHGTGRRDGGTKIKLEFRVRREGEASRASEQSVPTGQDFQFGLNGEAFVPEALPGEAGGIRQANEPDISHPLHAARTAEIRAQAAAVRRREEGEVSSAGGRGESFPVLGNDASAHNLAVAAPLVGWTAEGARNAGLTRNPVGRVTKEEFPSLGPGPGARNHRLTKARATGYLASAAAPVSNFSAAASSRPVLPPAKPDSTISYKSSFPVGSVPNMSSADNFPSLSGRGTASSAPLVQLTRKPASVAPNLKSAENFPSLGGANRSAASSGSSNPYAAAQAHTSKLQISKPRGRSLAPNLNSADNFPSLGGMSAKGPLANRPNTNPYAAAQAHARKLNAGKAPPTPAASAYPAPPSTSEFPPPPAVAKKSNASDAFAPKKPPPTDNVLHFPASSLSAQSLKAGKETVELLKLTLGTARYKRLKSLTRDFASGSLAPELYVDEAASLFDDGVRDSAFWEHVPSLINDVPGDNDRKERALTHLEGLRVATEMQELEFGGEGSETNFKKPIDYVFPVSKKEGSSWGTGAAAMKLGGSSSSRKKGNGHGGGNVGGGTKSKAKKKNDELRALAFGV